MGEVVDDRAVVERVVQDHAGWVFASARRRVGDPALAEEVTQAVFVLYWRKGAAIGQEGKLTGWLYRAVRYCCANALRLKRIRERHEREAAMERREKRTAEWGEVEGELEGAVDRLSEKDRQAVVLRFYRGLSLREVGEAVGIGEEAARKRVDRAVGRLRERLAARGVEVEGGSLAGVMLAHAGQGGPAGLVERVMGGMGGDVAGRIAKGAMKMMVWKKVAVVVIGMVVAGGAMVRVMARTDVGRASTSASVGAPAGQSLAMASADGDAVAEEADVTVLWAKGEKAMALARFASIQWASYRPSERLSVFTITEKEYASLPAADQRVVDGRVQSLKELARYAIDQGDAATARGDAEAGQRYYAAVRDCGARFVSDEQTLAVLKLVGRVLQDKVKAKLK